MKKLFLSLILILLSFNLFSNEPLKQNFFSYNNLAVGIYLYEEDNAYKISVSALEDTGVTMLEVFVNDIDQAKKLYTTYESAPEVLSRARIRNMAVELKIEGIIIYKDGIEIVIYRKYFKK